jgi:hypothetical protein
MLESIAIYAGIGLVIMVADKIVTVTPNKYDDLIVTAVKGAWRLIGGRFVK